MTGYMLGVPSPPARKLARVGLALVAGGVVGCFTGESLQGQPCRTDDDCNTSFAASGRWIPCRDGTCGAVCGDAVVVPGAEECDDGNDLDGDGCVGCLAAFCGDDVTWQGREDCDDGNDDDTDACVRCKNAACGDGFVWAGKEECDDGNAHDDDDCAGCAVVACGDGVVNPLAEVCDDGNADENDGCNARCEPGAERLYASGTASHTCAVRQGLLRCWGLNEFGQLGYGHRGAVGDEESDLPPRDVVLDALVEHVAVGAEHTCVVLDTGGDNVRCWGNNANGALGLPGIAELGAEAGDMPPPPVKLGGTAVRISAASFYTCALLTDGRVRCWGDSWCAVQDVSPESCEPMAIDGRAVDLAGGGHHTCALLEDASVVCWGYNANGELGDPNLGDDLQPHGPVPVKLGGEVVQLSTGISHSCVLLRAGGIRCWGDNTLGQVGYDAPVIGGDYPEAYDPLLFTRPIAQVSAGNVHTCVLLDDGGVRCWGHTGARLGNESDQPQLDAHAAAPIEIGGQAVQVIAGTAQTCARLVGGDVRCWGAGSLLALGHTDAIGDDPGEMPPQPALLYDKRP